MTNANMDKIVFLVLIAERKKKDAILTALLDIGVQLVNTIYGRGSVSAGYFLNTFGIVPEKEKTVITCVTTEKKADIAFRMLVDKHYFNKPNTGIAFTIPVDSLSF